MRDPSRVVVLPFRRIGPMRYDRGHFRCRTNRDICSGQPRIFDSIDKHKMILDQSMPRNTVQPTCAYLLRSAAH
ncbi:hypothetical protein TMatcc_005318 [Talaromyces marneffei ATCC 18224]